MAGLEMDSFVMKFKSLWNAGRNATLNLETIAGKVKVSLSVELDNPDGGEHPNIGFKTLDQEIVLQNKDADQEEQLFVQLLKKKLMM